MSILVTGGSGYKGARLVPTLLAHGHRVAVVVLNLFGYSFQEHPALRVIQSDFSSLTPETMAGIDIVILLASVANDPAGDLNTKVTWETNVLGIN